MGPLPITADNAAGMTTLLLTRLTAVKSHVERPRAIYNQVQCTRWQGFYIVGCILVLASLRIWITLSKLALPFRASVAKVFRSLSERRSTRSILSKICLTTSKCRDASLVVI